MARLSTYHTKHTKSVNAIDAYLYGIDSEGVNNTVKFAVNLTVPDSYSSGEFTDFDNLTKEQVAGWITSTLTAEEQQALKDKLSERLRMFYDKNGNVGIGTSAADYGKPATPWDVT